MCLTHSICSLCALILNTVKDFHYYLYGKLSKYYFTHFFILYIFFIPFHLKNSHVCSNIVRYKHFFHFALMHVIKDVLNVPCLFHTCEKPKSVKIFFTKESHMLFKMVIETFRICFSFSLSFAWVFSHFHNYQNVTKNYLCVMLISLDPV